MIKTASELVTVVRVDADIRCDGLGQPPCSRSLAYTIDDGEDPREAARLDGWRCDATGDLCPDCQRQPHRHAYAEPTHGPRWDKACRICDQLPEAHPEVS